MGDGTELQSAVVPVRWCLSKEALSSLKARQIKKPHILVVTAANNKEMSRQLIPLGEAMAYVPLYHPGFNRIYATIVWDSKDSDFGLEKKFVWKEDGDYRTQLISEGGSFLGELRHSLGLTHQDITVPQELFAKATPGWVETWVNMFHSETWRDECHFRERALYAFTLKPFLVLSWFALSIAFRFLAAFILWAIGLRDVNWSPILRPWMRKAKEVWENVHFGFDGIYVFKDVTIRGHKHTTYYLWPFAPIVPLVLFRILYYKLSPVFGLPRYLETLIFTGVSVIALCAISAGVQFIVGWNTAHEEKKVRDFYEKQVPAVLLCDGVMAASIDALPRENQTIRLKFGRLKSRICRPRIKN